MYSTKKLGDLGKVIRGVTYSKGDLLDIYDEGCLTLLRANNINDGINFVELQYLPKGFVEGDKILKEGDIIFCMSSGSRSLVGKNTIVPELQNYSFGAFCSSFRLNSDQNINYIGYFLKSEAYKKYIYSLSQGVNILNLRGTDLENLEIPLPPLPIQSRIVEKLDEAFMNIGKQIELLWGNIEDVENMKKSVLFDFFGGENQLFSLSDYVDKLSGIALPEIYKNSFGEGNFPFYKVGEMNNDQKVMTGATLFFNEELAQKYKIKIFPKGTIVFPKRGGAIFTEKKRILIEDASYDSNIMGLRANNKYLTNEYLFAFMRYIKLGDYADNAGIAQINNKHIDLMKIPLPPLPRQQEIVAHLDVLFDKSKILKSEYEAQIQDLESLKQSLLEEAFAGRLITE